MTNIFSAKGRIGRGTFFLTLLGIWACYLVCCFVGGALVGAASVVTHSHLANSDVQVLVYLLLVPFSIMDLLQVIKRSHDLGMSGWFAVATRIPFIGMLAYLPLLFCAGTLARNRFGENPNRPQAVVMSGAWAS